jgi:hypothetical protein
LWTVAVAASIAAAVLAVTLWPASRSSAVAGRNLAARPLDIGVI